MRTTLSVDDTDKATILAALRYYQQNGQGDPANRSDAIHDIATNCDQIMASLDTKGIDELCERINIASKPPARKMTRTEQRRLDEAQSMVDDHNARFPSGSAVTYYELIDPLAKPHETITEGLAWVMGGHSAMVKVQGISGGVCLEHIRYK